MSATALAAPRLPEGLTVRLRDDVHRLTGADGADLLVGGTPLRVLRLSPAAWRVLADGSVRVADPTSATLAASLLDAGVADPVLDTVRVDPADLTVVVPVRDRARQLDQALAALGSDLRVLVVDDASADPVGVAAVAARHGAEVVALPRNLGPAGARNAGLARVATPYVAFVDSDITVSVQALLRLARHLLADSRVALVGPRVAGRSPARAEGRRPSWFERYDEAASSLSLGERGGPVRPGAAVAWLPSACLVGRVAALRHGVEPAGFDERLRVAEDVDLVWRLVAAGHTVRYDPEPTAWHETRTTVRSWLGRKVAYGTGGAALARRHGLTGAPAVLSPTVGVAAAAVLARRRWSLPVAAAGFAVGVRSLERRLPATLTGRERHLLALRLAAQGQLWGVRQESALLLRHWWPLTLAALPVPLVRRALVSALVVDTLGDLVSRERPFAPLSRRLDDLAYGAGLWLGAVRARSVRCLLPRRPGGR